MQFTRAAAIAAIVMSLSTAAHAGWFGGGSNITPMYGVMNTGVTPSPPCYAIRVCTDNPGQPFTGSCAYPYTYVYPVPTNGTVDNLYNYITTKGEMAAANQGLLSFVVNGQANCGYFGYRNQIGGIQSGSPQ